MFLDRDGTLIEEVGYLDRLERLAFFPFTSTPCGCSTAPASVVVVVTNQAGIAPRAFDEAFVAEAHAHIAERLAAGGARDRRVLLLPASSGGDGRRRIAGAATAASRSRACCGGGRASSTSISRARSSSAIAGTMSRRRARSARAACWCGPATGGRGIAPRPACGRRGRRQPDRRRRPGSCEQS